jgi:hypothetical protein
MMGNIKYVFLFFGALILLFGIFVIVVFTMSRNEQNRLASLPIIPVTFDTITSHDEDKVSLEGEVLLGNSVSCEFRETCGGSRDEATVCPLRFGPTENLSDFYDRHLNVYLEINETSLTEKESNSYYLSYFFDPDEFRLFTNDGRELTLDDPVRVVGIVSYVKESNGATDVYLCVSTIEAGSK